MVYVAILGHGVVGSGVAEVLRKNADSIAHKAGEPIEIRRILDLREFPSSPRSSTTFCTIRTSASWWKPWAVSTRPTIS